MAEQIIKIAVAQIDARPDQIRKHFSEDSLLSLGQNIKVRQILPIITYRDASTNRYVLADGERRWRAAQLVGLKSLDSIVLDHMPTATELYELQLCMALHSEATSVMEKADHLLKIKEETNCSISELAERLSMKQPLLSKLLKCAEAGPELRAALQTGFDLDKAYTIASEPDLNRQRELLAQAKDLTREQLRQKAKSGDQSVELCANIARFSLPKGFLVTVQGPRMTLSTAIQAMQGTVKELRRGESEGWDITTAQRVLRDRSNSMK